MLKGLNVKFIYEGKEHDVLLLCKSPYNSSPLFDEEAVVKESPCSLCGEPFEFGDTLIRDPMCLGCYTHVACISDDNCRGSELVRSS